MKPIRLAALLSAFVLSASLAQTQPGKMSIDLTKPGAKVSPLLYGIFFEEINRAGEGGIYAEMIQNRSFEDADFPQAWKSVNATISLDKSNPINSKNPTNLKVVADAGGGIVTGGFSRDWERRNDPGRIPVAQGKRCDLSFYTKSSSPTTLIVTLKGVNGKVLATQKVNGVGTEWKKYNVPLVPTETDGFAKVIITTDRATTFWLDMVSMFPTATWKNRKNGLRADLMEKIAAMKPAFVRFPGGCFVEGIGIENRVQWKNTVGPVDERPGHLNRNWGYYSSDGLGYHEYLQMCEDLGAEPLFVINCGMAHPTNGGPLYAVPMDQMQPYVQDALDAIEYANGPATSKWGAMRAQAGHPEPFKLKMMEIGNEESGRDYEDRFVLIFDAIKAKYPDMQLIANEPITARKPDMVDPHHYGDFASLVAQFDRFNQYNRNDPKIFFGEYAQTDGAGMGNLKAALSEAVFMSGLERNGDVVKMSSYAPLLCHPDWRGWNPNAILFNQAESYGTPSYWNQVMFAANRSDENLPVDLTVAPGKPPDIVGKIGVGSWGGQAEFREIKVIKDDKLVYESDFSKDFNGWQTLRGAWEVRDGALRVTNDINGSLAMYGESTWNNYTLRLKARKIGGPEGFLVTFGAPNEGVKSWWNLGGWGNRWHTVESPGMTGPNFDGKIETDRWYDVKIEIKGGQANFYLDDQLIHSITRTPTKTCYAIAGKDAKTGEVIVKFINTGDEPRQVNIELKGAKDGKITGQSIVLTSANASDENSFETPTRITPKEESFTADVKNFSRTFAANSVTILRLK